VVGLFFLSCLFARGYLSYGWVGILGVLPRHTSVLLPDYSRCFCYPPPRHTPSRTTQLTLWVTRYMWRVEETDVSTME
jgi:hypothetical protein